MKIAVCGGGASGIMAAVMAAKNNASVTVFELNPSPLKKLLATGNGRCNFSNKKLADISSMDSIEGTRFLNTCFHSYSDNSPGSFLYRVFRNFGYDDTISFFESIGIMHRLRADYLYPASDQALSIREALLYEAYRNGVDFINNAVVSRITPAENNKYLVNYTKSDNKKKLMDTSSSELFDRVIISTGSPAGLPADSAELVMKSACSFIGTLNLSFSRFEGALTRLICKSSLNKAAGVRTDCLAKCYCNDKLLDTERGELQITKDGISGIMVFQFSSKAAQALKSNHSVFIELDFCPDHTEEELLEYIHKKKNNYPKMKASMSFNSVINQKLLEVLLEDKNIGSSSRLENFPDSFIESIKKFRVNITGTGSMNESQVAAGGLPLSLLNENMMLKKYPGLFVTGEFLDIDGKCGGFNLQAAWSTGAIAGMSAALPL